MKRNLYGYARVPVASAGCWPTASRSSRTLAAGPPEPARAESSEGRPTAGDRVKVAALDRLDRLTHQVHILEMNGDSYRLKHSRQSAASQAADEPGDS